jgi:hypothetical protein
MSPTRDQLLSIVLNYWQSFKDYDQKPSPEDERRFAVCEEQLKEHDRWLAFLDELDKDFPGFTIGDYTGPGPCFCCVVYPPETEPQNLRWVVAACVSFLAPVYTVYGVQFNYSDNERVFKKLALWPLPSEIQATADIITRRLEETFKVTALPHELAELRVPLFVRFTEPPETRLFHALFLDNPENLP